MTERLTLAQCAPGVVVVLRDDASGERFTIDAVDRDQKLILIRDEVSSLGWSVLDCFTLAPAPPAPVVLTDELRAALVAWYAHAGQPTPLSSWQYRAVIEAIEATPGLLPDPAPPPPGTTDALQIEGWM